MRHDALRPHRPAVRMRDALRRPFALSLVAFTLFVAACGGSSDDAATTPPPGGGTTASPVLPGFTATTAAVSVVMPTGSTLTPDKLAILTSLGTATPSSSGAATLAVYADAGTQLAVAVNAKGNSMMMGWIDATHTTISAQTTADVLAYFALGGPRLLRSADAQALIAAIPSASGIGALEATLASTLAANPDAFAAPNASVNSAIAAFAQPLYSDSRNTPASTGRMHAQGILIDPVEQSGITVLQDPPYAAHLSNSYRRRAFAFVDRVSETVGGVETASPAAMTSFEVTPVVGVNGGVTGAITDIMNAYYGNQQTAYAAVTSPDSGSFAVPLTAGSDKTTYRVTVVGPGASAGVESGLTAEQSAALTEVALRGFVKDFLAPTLANAVLGSGAIDFSGGSGGPKAQFMADVLANLTPDFINYIVSVPGVNDKIAKGQWFDAGVDLTGTVAGSNTLRTLLVAAFDKAVAARVAAGLDPGAMSGFMTAFNNILNAAGGVLQVFDSSAYLKDLAYSDRADQFKIAVNGSKVVLNPVSSNVDVGGTSVLTASVLGVDDLSGYSFHWTTTTAFGDLNEIAGGGRTHQTDYCSSSPQALFVYEHDADDGTSDTVSVDVYSGSNCDPAKGDKLGTGTATVMLKKNNGYTIYGGPGGYDCGVTSAGGNIPNDDSITFFLNGTQIFYSGYTGCGGIPPLALPNAKKGDVLRVVVRDEAGHHSGMSGLYMLHDGQYVQVDPGFNRATADGQDNGVQYDHSFSIPF